MRLGKMPSESTVGERRRMGTEHWRAPPFEEVQAQGKLRVKTRLKEECLCEFVCAGGWEPVVEVLHSLKCLFLKIRNKVLMVEPVKTRVSQATSKTKDWVMQGQFLLLTFQSFNSCYLPWGRMIRNGKNVHERGYQEWGKKCSTTNKVGSLITAVVENKCTLNHSLPCLWHCK